MAERAPDDEPHAWEEARLVAGLRREEHAAFVEFHDRFAPLLRRLARGWGVPAGEREPLVGDVLGDVALSLARRAAVAPRSLAAYLAAALRHRLGVLARERRRSAELLPFPDAPPRGTGRMPTPSREAHDTSGFGLLLCSEHARRAADPAWGGDLLDPAVARLADHLSAGLREDDQRLLLWLAHHVPLRTAAGWLGIGYEAAGKRAQRLRARLRARAESYAAALPEGAERRAVHAFLRRAAAPPPDGGAPPQPAPGAARRAIPTEETDR